LILSIGLRMPSGTQVLSSPHRRSRPRSADSAVATHPDYVKMAETAHMHDMTLLVPNPDVSLDQEPFARTPA
jgi:hypothetical protein